MKRALHYLRIGWILLCGVLCILLLVLWVRSYWWCDFATKTCQGYKFRVVSCRGKIGFAEFPETWMDRYPKQVPPDETNARQIVSPRDYLLTHGYVKVIDRIQHYAPAITYAAFPAACILSYWELMLLFVIGGVTVWPWSNRWTFQFSLRTLLIAITAVAVGLWFIVWMTGK